MPRASTLFPSIAVVLLLPPSLLAQNQPTKQPPTRISKPPAPPVNPAAKPNPAKPAQPGTRPPSAPLESVTLDTGGVEMSDQLFRLDTAGLAMNLPIGAVAQVSAAGTTASAQIMPSSETGAEAAWLITIRTPRSRDKNQTPETVARKVMLELQSSVGVVDRSRTDREGNVIEKLVSTKALTLEPIKSVIVKAERPEFERPAARFYIQLPKGDKDPGIVRGYTVFQSAPGEFITFELATAETNFTKAKPLYEATIATARFHDAAALATQRGAAIDSGVNFFARMASPDYDAAIAALNDQWYRLYKPNPGGAEKDADEVAYRRIRAKRGSRGEIDTRSKPENWGIAEREQGIVVRFDARYLQDGMVVDVVGVYWMSGDARSEAWTLQQAIRDPRKKNPQVVTETGARDGLQMTVALSGPEKKNIKPEVPKVGYITQVQSFLLPTMMAQKQIAGDYAFYAYQSQNENIPISMRRDSLAPGSDGSTNWILTTQQSDDRPPQVSTFNDKGELLQTVFSAQKLVWTPTTLAKLAELWQAKGLPMN
jgi:hypothetical protein